MKIRTKILSGYIIIITLTFLISAISYGHFYLLQQKFNLSEKLAFNLKTMDQIVDKAWETRFFMNRYIYRHDYIDNQKALKSLSHLKKLIVDVGTLEMNEQRLSWFNRIHELVIPYHLLSSLK